MAGRSSHSLKAFAAFGILAPSAVFLLACPPPTDHVRVKNLSADTMRLTFVFPQHAPENGRLPEDCNNGYRLHYWMHEGVADAEAGPTGRVPLGLYARSVENGFVLTIPPQHTLWIRQYKTGSNPFPDTLYVDRGKEHRALTNDYLIRHFRTHRSRDLF